MNAESLNKCTVAVIGAGPAGLFAARQLAAEGVQVVVFNRDIKPGGLAEYGIYPTKYKMKAGLRKQFRRILQHPLIDYYGNVTIGQEGDLTLADLQALGFQARLAAVGAQGTKWLGLPGEDIARGVYHAKDLVYHYNKLPPFSQTTFHIGRRVALIGVGNVMVDIARWVIRTLKVDEVIAVARRGPAEIKFTRKEMESVIANLDLDALDAEMVRVAPFMEAVGQEVEAAKTFILSAMSKALDPVSKSRFRLNFLASPTRILGDPSGRVSGLEVEETTLVPRNGDTRAKGLGIKRVLDVDTVVFCIGDRVDENLGLPIRWNEFVKNPEPRFPKNGLSYEAYNLETGMPVEGVFVAGWAREASSGLVGVARKDGTFGAKVVIQYLETLPLPAERETTIRDTLGQHLRKLTKPVITKDDIQQLEVQEQAEASRLKLEEYKFSSNEEMLAAMGLA